MEDERRRIEEEPFMGPYTKLRCKAEEWQKERERWQELYDKYAETHAVSIAKNVRDGKMGHRTSVEHNIDFIYSCLDRLGITMRGHVDDLDVLEIVNQATMIAEAASAIAKNALIEHDERRRARESASLYESVRKVLYREDETEDAGNDK